MRLFKESHQQQGGTAPAVSWLRHQGNRKQREQKEQKHKHLLFDERVTGIAARRNPSEDAIMEVRSYLEEPLQISADPLSWWKNKASIYPRLTKVMTERLCIVATSVPSERVFSKTGQIITERRNRISPSKVRQLAFLNANIS